MITLFKKPSCSYRCSSTFSKGLFGLLLLLTMVFAIPATAQPGQVQVNLSGIDGIELTPGNLFNYQLQSGLTGTVNAVVRGRVVFRTGGLSFSYSYTYTLRPGLNRIDGSQVRPQWTYSSQALKELFMEYGKLPAGTYEYCVEVSVPGPGSEAGGGVDSKECVYHQVDDLFLINLVDPEDDAKIYERYPVLSWMVNYAFAHALTYKVRVAEVKKGQNNTAAVNRNNAVYQESNLRQPSVSYPVYAKQLELNQPYAWTVDAYYKGILLGGAAPWRFTIVEDSVLKGIPRDIFHLDIRKETNGRTAFAIGKLKLKYFLEDFKADTLSLKLTSGDKELKLKDPLLAAIQGDNRYEIDFYDKMPLKHLGSYTLELSSQSGEKYIIQFKYVNPDFLK